MTTIIVINLSNNNMATCTIIYSNNKYQLLKYYSNTKPLSHELLDIIDDTNKLQSIVPKSMKSYMTSQLIVDIGNNFHYVFFNHNNNTVENIYSSQPKLSFNNFRVVGYYIEGVPNGCATCTLIQNMDDSDGNSYQCFKFVWINNKLNTSINITMDDRYDDIHHHSIGIVVKHEDDIMEFYTFETHIMIHDSVNGLIDDIYYTIDKPILENHGCKYKFDLSRNGYGCTHHIFECMINNDNVCCIKNNNNPYKEVHKMTPTSILFNDGKYITILDSNHVTIIKEYDNIIKFTLSNVNIQHFGNTKIRNLVWSEEVRNKLPNNLKNSIKTFMMYNKRMTTFKIPYCVLNMVFTYLIN